MADEFEGEPQPTKPTESISDLLKKDSEDDALTRYKKVCNFLEKILQLKNY